MPPTTPNIDKDKERPASRKRSPSVIHKVWSFARNAGGSKTPPTLPPSHSRTTSLQPTPPLLQPATSNVTAPGSILQTGRHSPTLSPLDAQSLEASLTWFASHVATLNAPRIIVQLRKLERTLHAPSQTRPPFALIHPILAHVCGPDAEPALRRAGFSFLIAYLETPPDDSSNLERCPDNASFWYFIRSAPSHHLSHDDWEQRLKALQVLTSDGGRVDGLVELIPTLLTWQVHALESMSDIGSLDISSRPDALSERIDPQRRAADIQRLILQICEKNVLTLTERDEECTIVTFLNTLEAAIREPCLVEPGGHSGSSDMNRKSCLAVLLSYFCRGRYVLTQLSRFIGAPTQRSSSRASTSHIPSLQRPASRHKRSSSSQSLQLHGTRGAPVSAAETVAVAPQTPWAFQAASFVKLFSVLCTKGPPSSEYIHPAIQSLLFILGSAATPLPPIGTMDASIRRRNPSSIEIVDGESSISALEYESWHLISDLLSNFGTTIAYEIRQNLVPAVDADTDSPHFNLNELKKSCGAARALRLILRQNSQHELSGNEDIEEFTVYPAVVASHSAIPQRFGRAGVGSSWIVIHARDIIGKAVAFWVAEAADRPSAEAEAVVLECIGIADDTIAECVAADRTITDDEAHIVGDILCEAVECLRMQ